MTDSKQEQVNSEIQNKSSMDERKILSRLIIQKIIGSDASKFLRKDSYDRIMKLLISEHPDEEFHISYRLHELRDSYYNTVTDLTVKWTQGNNEINDLHGNVWTTHNLVISATISAAYSNTREQFGMRAECIGLVNDLIDQINALVPQPIRVMSLNSLQRQARDEKNRIERISSQLSNNFEQEHKAYRTGLRRGGRGRNVPRNALTKITVTITPGTYSFQINEGTRRCPRYKKYTATFPHNEAYPVMIKRVD
jgi:hypothetical protein